MNIAHYIGACLLLGGCGSSDLSNEGTRARVVSEFQLVIKSHDRDADGKLNSSEIQSMIDQSGLQPDLRERALQEYLRQDLDKDGYLDIAELIKEPLATFDCIDANRDDHIGRPEIEASALRCGSSEAVAI
ncbi:MAG: hypothetical protein IE934_11345 [Sphingopyxis sp.]|nr:hypothetical protein [Sphingopyxis sp.]